MRTTRVFKCGNSLAVRLPKDFRLEGEEVEILKQGKDVVIREIPRSLSKAFHLFASLSEDFFSQSRVDLPPQERDPF